MAEWADLLAAPRHANAELARREIPARPGVYAWFKAGECVYVGVAANLRKRLSTHRGKTADLSRSTLRASVAVKLLGVTRTHARQRPPVMTIDEISVVTAWFADAAVAWIECATVGDAHAAERHLLGAHTPPFNLT